jgi:hypothetical protein
VGIDRTPQGLEDLMNGIEEIKTRLSGIEDKLDELTSKSTVIPFFDTTK